MTVSSVPFWHEMVEQYLGGNLTSDKNHDMQQLLLDSINEHVYFTVIAQTSNVSKWCIRHDEVVCIICSIGVSKCSHYYYVGLLVTNI